MPTPEEHTLCLASTDVRRIPSRGNPQKAAGPDNTPGRVLKDCADCVLTDIFNISRSQAVVLASLKKTTKVFHGAKEVNSDMS